MKNSHKNYGLLTGAAFLFLVSCETETNALLTSRDMEQQEMLKKDLILEGSPEYEDILKYSKVLPMAGDKNPVRKNRNSGTLSEREFEIPQDILYGWGLRKSNFDKMLVSSNINDAFVKYYVSAYTTLGATPKNFIPDSTMTIDSRINGVVSNAAGPNSVSTYRTTPDNYNQHSVFNGEYNGANYYVMGKHMRRVYGMTMDEANSILFCTQHREHSGYPRATAYFFQNGIENNMPERYKNPSGWTGIIYNFGVWADYPLLYNVYQTGTPADPWAFMEYDRQDILTGNNISVFAARANDKYKDWSLKDKSVIYGKYKNEKENYTYSDQEGNLKLVGSSDIVNRGTTEATYRRTITVTDVKSASVTHSGTNTYSMNVSASISKTAGVNVGLASSSITATLGFDFGYVNSRTTDNTETNETSTADSEEITVAVPAGRTYRVLVYSYTKEIKVHKGAYLKTYQKLFQNKENMAVPPFVSVSLCDDTPFVNIPIRKFAAYSGVFPANGYGTRYLYTGIDFTGGNGDSNKNAYDLLWMGDVEVKVQSTNEMQKRIEIMDVTNPNNPVRVP
ncbi:hypothetical protein ACR1PO_03220 [Chryseobacterium sp. RRHN12]|uniref:hypothetical protein n=1 Tax=Chryseobacterium sp. RRHN12 TaxID=3437884 RepID=UPI003D9AE594